jgi:hypothetical protein
VRSSQTRLFPFMFLTLVLGIASAQTRPNLSGTWKLNIAKSDFGRGPTPDARTDKIVHEDPNLKDTITQSNQQGEITYDMNYFTDGKETTNTIRKNEFKSVAHWEGDQLAIESKGSMGGAATTLKDHWSLSEDGKTLTLQRHAARVIGSTDQKMVFDKQ